METIVLSRSGASAVPADLLRYEMVVSHEPVTDATLVEIVGDVYLPLLRGHG